MEEKDGEPPLDPQIEERKKKYPGLSMPDQAPVELFFEVSHCYWYYCFE